MMKILWTLFFLCIAFSAYADSWTQKASYPGMAQELPLFFSVGEKGYVGCGSDADDFWEYDPQTDSWTQKANVPGGSRRAGVGFSIGNKGYAGTGQGWLSDFYEYDPVANTWTQKASVVGARWFATGFSIGDKGYIGCGQTNGGTFLNDFWEYDPVVDTWTQKSSLPFPRTHCVGFGISGKGYITTGLGGSTGDLNDMWEYDPVTDTWTEKANLPADGRSDASGFVICDKGYLIAGGEGSCYDDCWLFDPVNNLWIQKTDFPGGARDDGAAFVIGETGYFGLGQLGATTDINDFWSYTPDSICTSLLPDFIASETNLCEKFCIDFSDQSINNPTAWQWYFPGGSPDASSDQNPVHICYQIPGNYDVTLITTNAMGTDTLTLVDYITVYSTPAFPEITQDGNLLTSSMATGYQWQFNAVDIPGATNQSYEAPQSGYYSVIISDEHGCVSSATTYLLIDGIAMLNTAAGLLIYPNPSDGVFIVEVPEAAIAGELKIEISNAVGQLIFSEIAVPASAQWNWKIDLRTNLSSDILSGIYHVKICHNHPSGKAGEMILHEKLVVVK
jgi:N-acetylneuraminic acid mutarotase